MIHLYRISQLFSLSKLNSKYKKALPQAGEASAFEIEYRVVEYKLMVAGAVSLHGVVHRLDHAEGHTDSDDIQCEPQTAVEQYVTHVPNPFKRKRKHIFSS